MSDPCAFSLPKTEDGTDHRSAGTCGAVGLSGPLIDGLYPSLTVASKGEGSCFEAIADLVVASASEPALQLFGAVEGDTLAGHGLHELVSFESAPTVEPLLAAAARGSEAGPAIILVRTLDARSIAVRVAATPAAGGAIRLLFSVIERPEEVASRLQISEQRYARLFNDVPIALMRVNSRGTLHLFATARDAGYRDLGTFLDDNPEAFEAALDRTTIVEANDQSVRMFGSEDPASVLCPVRAYFRLRPDTFRRIICAAFSGARQYVEETIVCGLGGQERHVLFVIALAEALEVEGNSFVGMIDISDRLSAEAALKHTQAEFARASRISLMGELTASIAHEVMQPLSSIAVNSATALSWIARSPPDVGRASRRMERVAADADRTIEIVRRLRSMASGGNAERSLVDLNIVAQESLAFIADEARLNDVVIETRRAATLPALLADPIQLQQVIVNLVNNAIQALAKHRKEDRRIVLHTSVDDEGWLDLVVQDNGPGIAEEHRARIFDNFFTTRADGIGMGLAICRSIVEAHLGTLTIEPGEEVGARARMRLPPATEG